MDRRIRRTGGRRLLAGISGFALTATLVVFHGGLLWQRLTDGSLLQPVVVVRWLLSALLILASLRLWNSGLSLFRGRRAGVLWLVVVLIHALAPGASSTAVEPVAEGMLPVALAMLTLLAFGLAAEHDEGSVPGRGTVARRRRRSSRASTGWYRVLFSRPPPVSLHP